MENKFDLPFNSIKADHHGVTVKISDKSYIVCEVIPGDCLNITQINFATVEEGNKMIIVLKDIASVFYQLPIDIYALPQIGDSLTEEELKEFLEDNLFELHQDDVDNTLYRWQ